MRRALIAIGVWLAPGLALAQVAPPAAELLPGLPTGLLSQSPLVALLGVFLWWLRGDLREQRDSSAKLTATLAQLDRTLEQQRQATEELRRDLERHSATLSALVREVERLGRHATVEPPRAA